MKYSNFLIAAALAGLCACGRAPEPPVEKPEAEAASAAPVSVEVSEQAQRESGIRTEVMRRASVPETFQAMGRVMQDAQKSEHVAAGRAGRLASVRAALGQAVRPGDVLASVRPSDGGPDQPVACAHKGIITAVHAAEGDQVNEMSFLFTVTEVDPLWGVLDIAERDLEKVRTGQKADIRTAAYPRGAFRGEITFISPEIDPASRTVKARVSIENPAGLLKFGMFIDASVRTGAWFSGIAVRADAVQNGPAGPFVFVRTGASAFAQRPVELGREKDGLVEITRGLSPGESAVVENAYLLKSEMMKSQLGED